MILCTCYCDTYPFTYHAVSQWRHVNPLMALYHYFSLCKLLCKGYPMELQNKSSTESTKPVRSNHIHNSCGVRKPFLALYFLTWFCVCACAYVTQRQAATQTRTSTRTRVFNPVCCLIVELSGSCLVLWSPRLGKGHWLPCFISLGFGLCTVWQGLIALAFLSSVG